eukprot:scaffold38354_cov75-Phaeocystis_antarctica.AAC.2
MHLRATAIILQWLMLSELRTFQPTTTPLIVTSGPPLCPGINCDPVSFRNVSSSFSEYWTRIGVAETRPPCGGKPKEARDCRVSFRSSRTVSLRRRIFSGEPETVIGRVAGMSSPVLSELLMRSTAASS